MKKRLLGIVMCMIMILGLVPIQEVYALEVPGWTSAGNGQMKYIDREVTVKIQGTTVYIEGFGEIPDYDPTTYIRRPWHYYEVSKVVIGPGITRIGSYAFANKADLKTIELYSSTFVADATCFAGIAYNPVIRLRGRDSMSKMIGTISYQSMDSIIANAPNGRDCIFLTDDNNSASTVTKMTYPYLQYVYPASDTNEPWNTKINTTKDIKFEKLGTVLSGEQGTTMQVHKKPQGELYMNVIAHFIKDYSYACSYSVTVLDAKNQPVYGTNGNRFYSIKLEPKDQIWNRKYKLLEIGPDGQIFELPDLDTNISTVTFETFYPTSTYALVYKYE